MIFKPATNHSYFLPPAIFAQLHQWPSIKGSPTRRESSAEDGSVWFWSDWSVWELLPFCSFWRLFVLFCWLLDENSFKRGAYYLNIKKQNSLLSTFLQMQNIKSIHSSYGERVNLGSLSEYVSLNFGCFSETVQVTLFICVPQFPHLNNNDSDNISYGTSMRNYS